VKEQVAAVLQLLGASVPSPGPGAALSAAPGAAPTAAAGLNQGAGATQLEPAVRSVLNCTLLPELVERQASACCFVLSC